MMKKKKGKNLKYGSGPKGGEAGQETSRGARHFS